MHNYDYVMAHTKRLLIAISNLSLATQLNSHSNCQYSFAYAQGITTVFQFPQNSPWDVYFPQDCTCVDQASNEAGVIGNLASPVYGTPAQNTLAILEPPSKIR